MKRNLTVFYVKWEIFLNANNSYFLPFPPLLPILSYNIKDVSILILGSLKVDLYFFNQNESYLIWSQQHSSVRRMQFEIETQVLGLFVVTNLLLDSEWVI